MELEISARVLQDTGSLGVSTRTLGSQVEYLASEEFSSPEGEVDVRNVASELEVTHQPVQTIFHRLEQLNAVDSTDKQHRYQLCYERWRTVFDRLHWLSESSSSEQINRLLERPRSEIQMITGSPPGVNGIPHPDITGRLVDMVANATETVTVVNPFFTREGLDLLIDALVGATERGVRLRIITRDVNLGTESNSSDVQRLVEVANEEGELEKLQIVEVDKETYPDASLHAKVTVVDQSRAYVGSANITRQSLQNAVELGLYLEGPSVGPIVDYLNKCWSSDLFTSVDV